MAHDVKGPFTRAGRPVFIAEAVRTPIGKSHPDRGWYRDTHPNAMLAACYTNLIARTGLNPAVVEDLIIGCTAPFGEQSRNIGRNAWLQAGYPPVVQALICEATGAQFARHFLQHDGGHDPGLRRRLDRKSVV